MTYERASETAILERGSSSWPGRSTRRTIAVRRSNGGSTSGWGPNWLRKSLIGLRGNAGRRAYPEPCDQPEPFPTFVNMPYLPLSHARRETSSQTRILKDGTKSAKIARAQHLQSLGFLQSLGAGPVFIPINRRNCSNRTVGLDRHDRTSSIRALRVPIARRVAKDGSAHPKISPHATCHLRHLRRPGTSYALYTMRPCQCPARGQPS